MSLSATVALLSLHVFLCHIPNLSGHDVIVKTPLGRMLGQRHTYHYSIYGTVTNIVDEFLGVPYSKSPTGLRRWQPPAAAESWSGIRNATIHGAVCPQFGIFHPETRPEFQHEDCLYLNIYTPYKRERSETLYPVMVYIHGGSYEVGSGKLYNGRVLAQYGVVVITINYRLGALGFLSSGTPSLTGNFGIMDQIESLKWVNANIASFRGDPARVTIFGHSAGGASVGLLLTIPAAKGLFGGVIAQSGSAVASFSVHPRKNYEWYVKAVAHLFDCAGTDTDVILDCMRKIHYLKIVENRMSFPLFDPIDPEFRPVVDGVLIPDHPRQLFEMGHFTKVPFMTGTVKEEFDNYFNGGVRHKPAFDDALDKFVSAFIHYDSSINDIMQYLYTDWRFSHSLNKNNQYYDRGALLSDMNMVAPTVLAARLVSVHHSQVYQYHFGGSESYHSFELNFVFGAPFSGSCADEMGHRVCSNATEKEKRHSERVMQLWTNFAKHRVPTPPGHNIDVEEWQQYNIVKNGYLHLNAHECRMKHNLRASQVAFWNTVLPRLMTQRASAQPQQLQYEAPMWTFIALTMTMLVIIIILLIVLFRTKYLHTQYLKTQLKTIDTFHPPLKPFQPCEEFQDPFDTL